MTTDINHIVSSIVDALMPNDLNVQRQYFLTQSLLALARSAHAAGHKLGCQETIKEINHRLDIVGEMGGDEFTNFVVNQSCRKFS